MYVPCGFASEKSSTRNFGVSPSFLLNCNNEIKSQNQYEKTVHRNS